MLADGKGCLSQPAHFEQTIGAPLEFSGVGLHSGAPVTMRLLPAAAGSGIVFRRTDLDNFEIPATGRNVAKVSYATSLMRQGATPSPPMRRSMTGSLSTDEIGSLLSWC